MASLQENITLTMITSEQTTTTNVSQRTIPNLVNTVINAMQYNDFVTLANGANVITIPGNITKLMGVYVKNLGTGTQTISVGWTPEGGALTTIGVLAPNGIILYFQPSVVALCSITSITLTASQAGIPVEYKLIG